MLSFYADSNIMFYLESISHLGMAEVWFCRFCASNNVQHELVCSVHGSLDAWKLTDNTRQQADTCQIKGNVFPENKTASDFILMLWFGTGFKNWFLVLKDNKTFLSSTPLVSYTCMYKSGTHDFLYCLGPHILEVTETVLGRSIICCQEAVPSLSWSEAAISPLNLFCRVVTSDMKYSSWISGLMWHKFRSQSSSESDTVRGMFRLNPTRIAKQSWMKA